MIALVNESSECEGLSCAPVDALTTGDGQVTRLENLDDLIVELAIRRQMSDLLANFRKDIEVDTCVL